MNVQKGIFLSLLLIMGTSVSSGQTDKHVFSFDKQHFLLDGKPFQLISGEIHPSRIPRAYWRHRVQMIKAMGCNTVAAYFMWNYHETEPGVFDFKTDNRDVVAFLNICKEEGMWVLFRPGPYVCAEWDFGGLPVRLLKIPDIKIRCRDRRYMEAVAEYISAMAGEIRFSQCNYGGPILMLQIENEYGSYGNDKGYLEALRDMWRKNGINVPFYTSDGPTPYMLEAGNIDGAAIGLDSGSNDSDFAEAAKRNPDVPAFSSETYPGWLTHWGERFARPDTVQLKKEVSYLLENQKSFNFYVIHGGTNFGFTAGANASSPTQYQPDITSYDYDAPINEQGQPTPKYFMLRDLISKYVSYPIPELPQPVKAISIPPIFPYPYTSIWQNLPVPIYTPQPRPMEDFDQNQGLILYRTKLVGHKSGKLKIWEPHDYALIFLNGQFIDTVYRDGGNWEVALPKTDVKEPVLDILVEGMGHINFAQFMIDRKGITERVTLNGMTLMNWETFLLPLNESFISTLKTGGQEAVPNQLGKFYKGIFSLSETGDTFFDMSGYQKGIVYINGHNLGRYWNIGPQYRLYCPAPWLKKGKNEIMIFDLLQSEPAPVTGKTTLSEDE